MPAKTIFAGAVSSMEKNVFFHPTAKTCQPCRLVYVSLYLQLQVLRATQGQPVLS